MSGSSHKLACSPSFHYYKENNSTQYDRFFFVLTHCVLCGNQNPLLN